MSSPSVILSAAPWRGPAAASARRRELTTRWRVGAGLVVRLLGGTGLLALWIALWTFFILAVAAPAAQLHRASAGLPGAAVRGTATPTATASRSP
ncbi:MAG TPA: hypothetical protein VF400_17555 [Anaeromyxobacteraceae bacterium]